MEAGGLLEDTGIVGIGSCSQLEISNPALRYRVMNDAKTIPFCFSWTDTSREEKQREKGWKKEQKRY